MLPDVRWSKRVGVQRYLRLLSRLSSMTPGEAAARGIQIPLKRFAASRKRAGGVPERQEPPVRIVPTGVSTRDWLTQRLDERFFFGPTCRRRMDDSRLQDALARTRVVEMARALGTDGIDFLGIVVRVAPGKIDWHVDPRTKREAWPHGAIDEASAIGSEDADVKYVWEVNRHQYLTLLGRAFWHTGDAQFARDAVALIDDWISANPVGQGVNWCSHLEVAMRAISWLWTMPYLLAWPRSGRSFPRSMARSLADHHQTSGVEPLDLYRSDKPSSRRSDRAVDAEHGVPGAAGRVRPEGARDGRSWREGNRPTDHGRRRQSRAGHQLSSVRPRLSPADPRARAARRRSTPSGPSRTRARRR